MSALLVLLHGFNGSPNAWDAVRARLPATIDVFAPALAGHDDTPAPESFVGEVERLATEIRTRSTAPVHVCGYSLGGRLAFGLVAGHSSLFSRATIISANPGLTDDADRPGRAEQDEKWAALIEREGIERFIESWERQPLFASQTRLPLAVRELQRVQRRRHDPRGLAAAMRALSLARMPAYGAAVAALDLPIDLVTGSGDAKFTAIAADLATKLRRARHVVVPDVGHNVVLEAAEQIAAVLAGTNDR